MAATKIYYNHTFHIPVMGTGFTIDTSLKVAKYGISSVLSLVDDVLIEQMRKYYCEQSGEPFEPIKNNNKDARALRITAYLDLLDRLVQEQVKELQSSPFEKGSEITRYYTMLPDSPLKRDYNAMLETDDPAEKKRLQDTLRKRAVPGSIDVNVMTKLDRENYHNGNVLPSEYSDALSALRGFANSTLSSSIVCSAGMNQRFYSYFAQFEDFFQDANGEFKKKIVLKVSDYRSAEIQGRFLAKRGLWISEYRIESGLNCGGHAFPVKGSLIGPIMEEFKQKREELAVKLHTIYTKALDSLERPRIAEPPAVRLTVQGGIGTAWENDLLLEYYGVDGTGWGTPFLLVPEAVNMDDEHLEKLINISEEDVYLSGSSPLGVPFWNLRTSASEEARRRRIREGRPGSPCRKGYLRINGDLTEVPICRASSNYQQLKLECLSADETLTPERRRTEREIILEKTCICHDLSGSVMLKTGIDPNATPSICCGPNIVNFSKITSLEEMVGHIYGRLSLLTNPDRPSMFVRELMLYIDFFRNETEQYSMELSNRTQKYFNEFKENLLSGIEEYTELAEQYIDEQRERFLRELKNLREEIESIQPVITM